MHVIYSCSSSNIIGKYGSTCTSYIGMTQKKRAANRKGIGLTTLKRACNSTTNTRTKYMYLLVRSYAQNTLQRLANLRPEGERDGPKLPDCSKEFFILILLLLLFLIRCNSQTTQATELTQTRTQMAPLILQSSPIKEGTRHVQFKFPRTATVSYSTRHRNSANDSK